MSNQCIYNYQQYSPPISNGLMAGGGGNSNDSTSPINNHETLGSSVSSNTSMSSMSSYSFHTPRLRYYLSKSFDIEDDLEFCPEIPETTKKFNPYTATLFSPTTEFSQPSPSQAQSPRVSTPRIRKPIEIINPQTKMKVGSPATK